MNHSLYLLQQEEGR